MKSIALVVLTALPFSTAPLLAREDPQAQPSSAGSRADSSAYVHVHDSDKPMERAVPVAAVMAGVD